MNQWINYNLIYKPLSAAYYLSFFWRLIPELIETERVNADRFSEYIFSNLESLLKMANKNHPIYHSRLMEAGYVPGKKFDFNTFRKIQPMTKKEFHASMSNPQMGYFRASKRSTSGSTGEPLLFEKDHYSCLYMDAAMFQVYNWYGIKPRDPEGRIWGSAINPSGKILQSTKDYLLNRRRLSSFKMGDRECEKYWNLLSKFRPKYFYCYPNAAYHFAEFLKKSGRSGEDLELKVIICTGEILFPHHRSLLEEVFRCSVANEYGSTENGILAFQCPEGKLHVMSQNVFLEITDENGIPKPIGEEGRILVTELHSINIPFIRYSIGDVGMLTGEKCQCGRNYPVIDIKMGRIDDFIITKTGNKVYDAILAYSFKDCFSKFIGYQKEAGKLSIEYILRDKLSDHSILKEKEYLLKKYLGSDMEIEFKEVKEIIPHPSGKMKYFVSEIAK